MMLVVVAVAAALSGALLTRGSPGRRLSAAMIPLALLLLARPPRLPWPGTPGAALPGNATLAEVEAVLATTGIGAEVELTGDGIHPELLPLLAERVLRWPPSTERVGLAELSWPRRVSVGEPVRVRGRIDVTDSVVVQLVGPDGTVDSLRTDSLFHFSVVPRAAGQWTMQLVVDRAAVTLGVQVVPPPRLRIMVIAGRPDFEVPTLVRRLVAQDADVTVRTRLTRDRHRVEQWGRAPVAAQLSKPLLDSLDLMVLASGALASLSRSEQQLLVSAVDSGLGLLHLGDSPFAAGPLAPFALQRDGTQRSALLRLDSTVAAGTVRINALAAPDSLAFLHDSGGRAVAWRAPHGLGSVAATAISTAHLLSLAGHQETEASWWASLLEPLLRSPSGRWLVSDSAMVERSEPLTIEWVGAEEPTAMVHEATSTSPGRLIRPTDGGSASLRLWPRDSGWLSIAGGGDTLALLVAPEGTFNGIANTVRRRAVDSLAESPSAPDPIGHRPLPRLVGLVLLYGAIALAWRPR